MGKDIDEDLIEATIRRIQAQSAADGSESQETPADEPQASHESPSSGPAGADDGRALNASSVEPRPPTDVDDAAADAAYDAIEATIKRVRAQAAQRADLELEATASQAAIEDEDPIEATIRRVREQSALRANQAGEFAPAPLPPLDDDADADVVDEAIHFAEAHAQHDQPPGDDGDETTAWREQAPPLESTPWPGRDERMLGEPATWEIAAQRLEQGLQETQHEVRALGARLDALLPALERLTQQAADARPAMTVVTPSRKAVDDDWDDTPKVSAMQFGTPPRPPVFRDPSPQTATAAELVEEPQHASPAAAAPRLHAVERGEELESRLPRQYRITVEDKRRGVDLVPLHRAMQGLDRVKDMSLLSYSNGVAIVSVESVGTIEPELLRMAVEHAMSRSATIEIHNEQTMVVKIQEA